MLGISSKEPKSGMVFVGRRSNFHSLPIEPESHSYGCLKIGVPFSDGVKRKPKGHHLAERGSPFEQHPYHSPPIFTDLYPPFPPGGGSSEDPTTLNQQGNDFGTQYRSGGKEWPGVGR